MPDRDRSPLGHKPDYRLGWSSEYVRKSMHACYSVSIACRPAETHRWHGEIGSVHRSILVGQICPNGRRRVIGSVCTSNYNDIFSKQFEGCSTLCYKNTGLQNICNSCLLSFNFIHCIQVLQPIAMNYACRQEDFHHRLHAVMPVPVAILFSLAMKYPLNGCFILKREIDGFMIWRFETYVN